jgi:hypothetical protein
MINILFLAIALCTPKISNMATAHSTQELELSIWTEKSSYAVGETVCLEISLRNTGSKTIKTPKYFILPADDPNKNNLEIQVHDAAGNRLTRISHVMTGRALYYPEIYSISPGKIYRDSFQLAGTFLQGHGRKKVKSALWSLGENPEITLASEYPVTSQGTFKVWVLYRVDEKNLASLSPADRSTVWKGELTSNTIEIVLT